MNSSRMLTTEERPRGYSKFTQLIPASLAFKLRSFFFSNFVQVVAGIEDQLRTRGRPALSLSSFSA